MIDIASVVQKEMVEEALDDAVRRGLISLARLRWRVRELGRSGRNGIKTIRELLDERDGMGAVPNSVFETRLLRELRKANLPEPAVQYRVRDGRHLVAIPDFAYPDHRIAIEADSYRWHSGRRRWQRDLARRNALTALGWLIVHVTWAELQADPRGVTTRIRSVLAGT